MLAITQQTPNLSSSSDVRSCASETGLQRFACLHEFFEARAEAAPHAGALVAGAELISYQELNARANRIAHLLRHLGVSPETLVGVFMERSANLVIALMGVLKAGGAYLPMDPAYPKERLAFMLKDAQARIVLTQASLIDALRGLETANEPRLQAICLETDPRIAGCSEENLGPSAQAGNLAYIIYTSGSTGGPKGVALEHRNAVSLVEWAGQVYGARELSGVLAGTSICFDPSILEIFVPLSHGGKVILARDALALPSLPAAREVRLIFSVPSVARELLRVDGIPDSVETINLGGERLPSQLVEQLYARTRVKRVYDLYGPTETTTCSTYALRTSDRLEIIGQPIVGTQVYLLDSQMRPVPAGATGEICIGGRGVARGYLHRPEITRTKFIKLALEGKQPVRLYRTGDFGRLRSDGNLEFAGRIDEQVKIRGFRIEPGEIESVLRSYPAVNEAVVIAQEISPGEKRLAAYVVPHAPVTDPNLGAQLRAHLLEHLPEYMMPANFTLLDRFELTANGKLDRSALPAPNPDRAAAGNFAAPRTPTEKLLCRIWADSLGVKEVGIDDDFFRLGGDSLMGVAMIAEVRNETGLNLPIEMMAQAPSIRQLAAFIDQAQAPSRPPSDSIVVEIQPKGNRQRLFLVHGVRGGMLWGYVNLARHLGPDQPIYAFKAREADHLAEFDTFKKLAAHYVDELRRFQPEGPYALGGYCFGGNLAYEMARMLDQQGQRISLLVLINSVPLDSDYYRVKWSLRHAERLVRNSGYWIKHLTQMNTAKRKQLVRWKFSLLRRKTARWLWSAPGSPTDLDEKFDMSAVTKEERALWEWHVRLLDAHHHEPYAGKIVLLRSAGHPLRCSYDEQCGWAELALGGVEVRLVPGAHESVLEEPHVRVLAHELKAHLGALDRSQG